MIKNKKDYKYYLEADRFALKKDRKMPRLLGDEIWKFQRLLRKVEYYTNCKKGIVNKMIRYYYSYLLYRKGIKLGFSIPINVFDAGLNIAHYGTIVVNGRAKIGVNCRIHACTNIGMAAGNDRNAVPIIGNNVYIGPGAKIYGEIQIADNIAIGANSVVNKSFLTPNVTIAGAPAHAISNKGSEGLYVRGTDHVN